MLYLRQLLIFIMYYLVKTPWFLKKLFPKLVWDIPSPNEKVLYLTFDDGPYPGITEWVMDQLERYDGRGTFFCQGNRVVENPALFRTIRQRGHRVGNHTYDHPNGWKTENTKYFENVEWAQQLIQADLFRAPYGKMKISQVNYLAKKFKVILWDVVSGDFDVSLSKEKCLKNVVNYARPGSIVVFHDMPKAEERLYYALPRVLEEFAGKGFRFEAINQSFHETFDNI